MQSTSIQHEYAAARIADLRAEACRSELVREAREARRRSGRTRISLPWR